MFSGNRL